MVAGCYFLATTKYVHVMTAAELHIRGVTASATAMYFEERLMKGVHPCFEPEEAIATPLQPVVHTSTR